MPAAANTLSDMHQHVTGRHQRTGLFQIAAAACNRQRSAAVQLAVTCDIAPGSKADIAARPG